jgi:hypothetical protein
MPGALETRRRAFSFPKISSLQSFRHFLPLLPPATERYPRDMNILRPLVVLLLVFGGGGLYFGGLVIGGGGLGLILVICLIVYFTGGFRGSKG